MSDSAEHERELMDLLSAAWDDRLDESSRKRLEDLLARDDFAGAHLLTQFTRMHVDLEWLVSSTSALRKAREVVARAKRGPAQVRRWRVAPKAIVGIAAGVILALVGAWQVKSWMSSARDSFSGRDLNGTSIIRPPLPIGRLVGQAGARWSESHELQDGQTLLEGQVIDLVAGTVRISMDFGAEIALQAPCRATLISGEMVTLESGVIAVEVAEWAVGFKVRTNDLLVTDFGTRFMVHADARAGSEVHVLEGLVVANSLKQSASVRKVGAAQAVRVNAEGHLDAATFRRGELADALRPFRPLRSIRLSGTGVGLQEGDRDLHWLLTAGDSHFGPYPQAATVCAANARYGSNDPANSQWISVEDGTTSGVPVRTKFVFQTTFDLTGFDLRTVRLTGLILADNGVEEIRLNGRPLPIAPWHDWFADVTFFAFHTIEIESGFVPGKNVLSFVVVNDPDLPAPEEDAERPETPNPMGLRVEWRGSGRMQ